MRELVYFVATTVDGFIAAPDGSADFFSVADEHVDALVAELPETLPVHVRGALGIDVPNRRFDAVIMGRRTYDPAVDAGLTSAYPHLDQHVVSRTLGPVDDDTVTVVDSDPLPYVRDLKQRAGRDIWLCGGSELAGALLPEIDELALKVNPIVAGDGRPLFARGFEPTAFELVEHRAFSPGVALLRYRRPAG